MRPQVAEFERMIREMMPSHGTAGEAVRVLKDRLAGLGVRVADVQENLDAALAAVKSSYDVEIVRRHSIIKAREQWYTGPSEGDRHWPALKGYLENAKNWEHETVESIDDSSAEIVSLLANPAREQFRCRGLVVGYVQSGKTANMTAVIAKAVDAGYNLVVVLGGVTNKLRSQTQRRLDQDVVSRHRELWHLYTKAEEEGDFELPRNGQLTMPQDGGAQLAVMKKEKTRLEAFLRMVERTLPNIRSSIRALVIDDECDQASVNAATGEYDMSAINRSVRKIIRSLPAVSYVGYTATPFANVFIDPFPFNRDELDDLYPEDFITALPRPDDYFGAREVFGFDPEDAGEDEGDSAGRDMVRVIPPAELKRLRPAGRDDRKSFTPETTPGLENALLWFLLGCAVRRRRGQADSHMTMLVHVSQFVHQHTYMADVIRAWFGKNSSALESSGSTVRERLRDVWVAEVERVPLENGDEHGLSADDLLPWLKETVESLEVVVENGESAQRLDYTESPRTYIVVGGTVLARGLTLEGLTVSFFLRTSRQYDTLLQMGRWFGFRHGYADLPRLWSTSSLVSSFRALAHIEEEIREDISMYRDRETSPLDFAVRVRSIPGLAITSAAKMRHAYRTSISFEGRHVQTIRFDHRDRAIVFGNWDAAVRLVDDARKRGEYDEDNLLFREVPLEVVRGFLRSYDICEQHLDLRKQVLLDYLDRAADMLRSWHVGIISPSNGPESKMPLGFLGTVATSRRARLREPDHYADIKALMSKKDILIDAPDSDSSTGGSWSRFKMQRPAVPLMLLYPVNAKSVPRARKNEARDHTARVPLDAVGDLVGLGIVFPGERDRSGGYFSVELDIPTPEQLDEDGELDAG